MIADLAHRTPARRAAGRSVAERPDDTRNVSAEGDATPGTVTSGGGDPPPDPEASRPGIIWEERRSARCADCRRSLETPGLHGVGRDGKTLCFLCLEFECLPLGYGLRILRAIKQVLDRWPGGPKPFRPLPEHWESGHYLGPTSFSKNPKRSKS